jgi:hypothetical protein
MTTSLASLTADVITLTNRPDLVGETSLAIRAATLKAHHSDFYYKDLYETGIQFDFSLAQQSLEYKTVLPRWRALKYLRPYDNSVTPGVAQGELEVISPDNIFDSYSVTKENVCYVAGLELQIRTLAAWQYFLLGCYLNPDVTAVGYSSWIADEHPFAIVYEAAAIVFKSIGYDEMDARYRQMVQEEYAELKMSNIVAVGY